MKRFLLIGTISILFWALISCSDDDKEDDNTNKGPTYETIEIKTSKGTLYLWLYDLTPLHKENFLKLTRRGYYDSVIFHRVIKDFVIQTGDSTGTGSGGPGYTIPAEFDTSLKHVYGAVGAARNNNPEKRSSGSQFYIVQNKNGSPHLDMNYTVFGICIGGMDVVDNIANVSTDSNDRPIEEVYMTDVEVVYFTEAELLNQFGFEIPE